MKTSDHITGDNMEITVVDYDPPDGDYTIDTNQIKTNQIDDNNEHVNTNSDNDNYDYLVTPDYLIVLICKTIQIVTA